MLKMIWIGVLLLISLRAEEGLHAIRGGILAHSTGPVSNGQEEGVDLHAEVLWNETLAGGYYVAGADLSLRGETSFIYTGLSWEKKYFKKLHLGAFGGFGIHDGKLDGDRNDRRLLGSRVLFRVAMDVGWYLNDQWSLNFLYDHYSNLGIGNVRNQGNDNMGLRLSYYF